MEKWVSVGEAAAELSVTESLIRGWEGRGKIKSKKEGNKVLVELEDCMSFFAKSQQERQTRGGDDPFAVLRALPSDHMIQLWRFGNVGGPAFLIEMTPAEFSLGAVTRDFGGGHYLVKAIQGGNEKAQHTFKIEGPPKHPDLRPERIGGDAQGHMVNLIRDLVGQAMAQRPDSGQTVAQIPAENSEDQEERWLRRMLTMKQIFDHPTPPPAPVSGLSLDTVGTVLSAIIGGVPKFVEAIQAMGSLGSRSDIPGDSAWERLLHSALQNPSIGEIVRTAAEGLAVHPAPTPPTRVFPYPAVSNPKPQLTPQPIPSPPPPKAEEKDPLGLLILRAAKQNLSPDPYAEILLQNIPENLLLRLPQASPEQFLEVVRGISPELADYPGWIEGLRESMVYLLEEEEEQKKS